MQELIMYFAMFAAVELPPITHEMDVMVVNLGDRDFRTREESSKNLKSLNELGVGAYYKAMMSSTPEIQLRGQILLSGYYNVNINGPKDVYIDGADGVKVILPSNKKEITIPCGVARYYFESAKRTSRPEHNEYAYDHLRIAVYWLIYDLRRAGFSKKDISVIVDAIGKNSKTEMNDYDRVLEFRQCENEFLPLPWSLFPR